MLINQVKAGERELFERLIAPYTRNMYLLAYSILRNRQEAEDAVQEGTSGENEIASCPSSFAEATCPRSSCSAQQ